jgi:heme exporter protein C
MDPMQSSAPTRSSGMTVIAALWAAATLAVLVIGFREAIFLVPTEASMGHLQRIFYYHFGHAILALVFPYINCIASLAYLYWRRRDPLKALAADAWALAAAELSVLYVSIGLITGMLWARPIWGIWWTWDARLTTFLLLWLLYVSYLITRKFSSTGQGHTLAAVISVFAAIDVPITFMSISWWRTQHPSPVLRGDGHLDASFYPAVWWNLAGWGMWGLLLLVLRFGLERRRQRAEQEAALEAIEASLELTK